MSSTLKQRASLSGKGPCKGGDGSRMLNGCFNPNNSLEALWVREGKQTIGATRKEMADMRAMGGCIDDDFH
eukprot:scaffold390149_cov19-Prasinocladus_malaysianus.AAC.1